MPAALSALKAGPEAKQQAFERLTVSEDVGRTKKARTAAVRVHEPLQKPVQLLVRPMPSGSLSTHSPKVRSAFRPAGGHG